MRLYLLLVQDLQDNKSEADMMYVGVFSSVDLAKDYAKRYFDVSNLQEVRVVECGINGDFFSTPLSDREEYVWIFESGKLVRVDNMSYYSGSESTEEFNKRFSSINPDLKLEW